MKARQARGELAVPGISAGQGLPWRSLHYWLHSFTKPVEMRPIDPTLSLEAAPLAAAPSRGLTSHLQQRPKGVRAVEQP